MKRIIFSLFVLVAAAFSFVPAQLVVSSNQDIKITPNTAWADPGLVQCADGTQQPSGRNPGGDPCEGHGGSVSRGTVDPTCSDGSKAPGGDIAMCQVQTDDGKKCVKLSVPLTSNMTCVSNTAEGGAIFVYLKLFLLFLSGAVGIVVVLMLVIAGIQYISSAGDPGAIKAAKDRIVNAITALVLFALMYAILSFLIPGGLFS
jgi:hypothetical protein